MNQLFVVPNSEVAPAPSEAPPFEPADAPAIEHGDGGTEPPNEMVSEPLFNEGFGIRLGARRYYINLRIGVEKRSQERRAIEGQVHVSGVAFMYCVICSGAIMLFGTLCLLYLIKSGMGINFSEGQSLLHPLFELMGGA